MLFKQALTFVFSDIIPFIPSVSNETVGYEYFFKSKMRIVFGEWIYIKKQSIIVLW